MEIVIGKTAGFCYGVNNAVTKTIEEAESIDSKSKKIYCLGELVHNKQVVKKLENLGITIIDDLDEINSDKNEVKIVIRAHGVPPKIYKEIEEKGYEYIDLTCPSVLAIHQLAERLSNEDKYIFFIGENGHPEVIGTYGFCKHASIIEKEEDILEAMKQFNQSGLNNLAVIAQTTFNLEKFDKFTNIIKEIIQKENESKEEKEQIQLEIKNTICNATRLRQEETEKLSKEVQYMIIIGGRNSSNTQKLYDICQENCPSICIETVDELNLEEIKKLEMNARQNNESFRIGIMAGASTPQESIENVNNNIMFGRNNIDVKIT